MADLNKFIEWSKENPGCRVEIEIGGFREEDAGVVNKAWVYSSKICVGQYVSSVDEIDLEAEQRKNMEYQRRQVEEYFQKTEVV